MTDIPIVLTNAITTPDKPRILLVEDDPISAKLSSNLLAGLEPKIVHVTNGEEALALFDANEEFDLVLMDLYLPGLNGFKTTEAIRAGENFRTRPVPIIALTSNPLMENRDQFLKTTGFADYIMKPPRKDTFANAVAKHLENRPPQRVASWY